MLLHAAYSLVQLTEVEFNALAHLKHHLQHHLQHLLRR
jgi:hypothetical protein